MGARTFLVSDTHFGHRAMCSKEEDGSKIRHWDDPDKMDQDLIYLWNETVGPKDLVYHLGDVVINRRCLPTLGKLNGRKVLIKGNHDLFRDEEYKVYFEKILAYHSMKNYLLSHMPVHPASFDQRYLGNIHGHLHDKRVLDQEGEIDKRYYCVSIELTDWKPIAFDEVISKIEKERE